ncbi:hypothetical protein [Silicimonas algicola]|uniref:Uncharacterized protein n=1 Tax=Silicimonas algicola TaxID=1826607 RepID=A0A316GCB7_9RHOB|nr:hypothetical protein [Silicimonas algicola]PWK57855.1 hypothetical protein C8D95_102504 [Silicimonas algicola]
MEHLDEDDWARILFALRHFRHNDEFLTTTDRVTAILDRTR